jgi:2-polyprenyl-6-methoxyphenol hydroxylase-like FAD-dependent oxidoreductase/sugar lactone lactonase YvrE
MSGSVTEIPVLIAGGGPVGVTLSMDLALRGIKSIALERRRQIPPNPRCNTTNARSMEIFRRLGCADAVRAAGLPPDYNTDVIYMTSLAGQELTRYRRATSADYKRGTAKGIASDWPTPEPQHFISQLYLEPVLRKHAAEAHGVDLREGWEYVSLAQDETGVTVTAREVETGAETTFRAQYLVGADGSNSIVRRDIGARLEGIPELGRNCSTFIRSPDIKKLCARMPGWMYRAAGGGVLIAIDGEDLWLLHTNVPHGEDLATFDPEPAMFRMVGQPFNYEILGQARWIPRAMVANKFRERRVFLAGDAAHIWIPLGGFGMNAGVADAIAVGWRIAGVAQGWLDPKILDSYEIERAPIGEKVASQAVKWMHALAAVSRESAERLPELEASAAARQDFGQRIWDLTVNEFDCPGFQLGYYYPNSPIIDQDGTEPPPFSVEKYIETSWPGVRLPHIWRADGRSIFDQLGPAFTLLRIGTQPPSGRPLVNAAMARRIPLTVLEVPEAEAVKKYEGYGLVLVRPDQHVAWRSKEEPANPAAILDRVTGVLMPERKVEVAVAERVAGGFLFGEGLRAIGDRLVFSDMIGRKVLEFDAKKSSLKTLFEIPQQPNGLGVLPDGRLVITSMFDAKLYVVNGQVLEEYADLSAIVTGYLGDVVVDAQGRLYVDDIGARVFHGEAPAQKKGRLIRVDGPGRFKVVLKDLLFPNGLVISPDGQMLYLAETMLGRIAQCRISPEGDLSEPRPFVELTGDGMTGDHAGGVWACCPVSDEGVLRYDSAGRLTARVVTPGGQPVACALAGADQDELWIVGFETLTAGANLFDAMRTGETKGILWRAKVAPQP